jgi:hypothetical protein
MIGEMRDLIDFPCSDTWLDYYHERGLTPRRSARYGLRDETVRLLAEELRSAVSRGMALQESLIARLSQRVAALERRVAALEAQAGRASLPESRGIRPVRIHDEGA